MLFMNEKTYEVNELRVTLFNTLRALNDTFGLSLPSHIEEEFKRLTEKFGVLDNINTYLNIARILENKVNCDEYDFIQLNSHIFLKRFKKNKIILIF